MFLLTLVVTFGTKRAAASVYRSGWHSLLLSQASSLRSVVLTPRLLKAAQWHGVDILEWYQLLCIYRTYLAR